jgi:hypothetical protein
MKFELKHAFPCSPEQLWAITDSEEFEQRLAQASASGRELIEQRTDSGTLYTRRKISVQRELPSAMTKVLGSDGISYDQETWRPVGGNLLRWKITPFVLQGRFSGEGETEVRATATGCERIIRGDLTIRVPILGSKMEQRLVDDVSASYTKAADIIRDLLASA